MEKQTLTLKLDYRIISLVLLAVVIGMLALWRPWQNGTSETRKITVSGEATVKATPDQYLFYPSFSRTTADVEAAKNELNAFGSKLLEDLKALGVPEEKIKLDSSSYDDYRLMVAPDKPEGSGQTVSLQATITVDNKEMAQKVQDYLAGTDAKGQLTPQAGFSTEKQKQLESEARQRAIDDAKAKAQQTAANLDTKLGKVIEIKDGAGFGGCYGGVCPLIGMAEDAGSSRSSTSIPITPGENELSFSVEAVFALR